MATVDQLNARLASLYIMRDSGVIETRHGDTSVRFRSMEELERAISALLGEIAGLSGKRKSRVSYIVQRTKGY